jgi:site-specific DNA recombinase
VNGERLAAERELGTTVPKEPMTAAEVRALVTGLRSTVQALSNADPALKAELYAELGIRLVYHSDGRVVVESRPAVYSERVGGGV